MCQVTSGYCKCFSEVSLQGMKFDVHSEAHVRFEIYQAQGLLSLMPFCTITGYGEKACSSVTQKHKFSDWKVPQSHLPVPVLSV